MNIQGNHPLAEIILRKLSGIEGVPPDTARTMVYTAASKAVNYTTRIASEIDTWKASADDAGNCKVPLKILEEWSKQLRCGTPPTCSICQSELDREAVCCDCWRPFAPAQIAKGRQ